MDFRKQHAFVRFATLAAAVALFAGLLHARASEPQQSDKTPGDPVAALERRLDSGAALLTFDGKYGYLESVLHELKVPASSQSLVFSKTSLQRDQISPATPRAIYFNDDTYVGYCRDGNVLEIATIDPAAGGTVFYTLEQSQGPSPKFLSQTDSCTNCHDSAMTRYAPGLMIRSVAPDRDGVPILSDGTTVVTQETPMDQRWGGWYVTGTHGKQRHRGNTIVNADAADPASGFAAAARPDNGNVTDLSKFCDVGSYPTPHSDLVALMVLAHQAEMHNLMGRARTAVERALSDERVINEATGRPSNGPHSDSTKSRIKNAAEPLLRYMLFADEVKLAEPVKGSNDFAAEFAARGPHDAKGRSLRDFDLNTRLFKFPCSYLIYSPQWDALPPELLEYLYRRLWLISHEKDRGGGFDHLTTDDRDAIREILLETKSNLPEYWKESRR